MIHIYCLTGEITMNTQNNKTHKKTTSLNHKHSYRKLRRWVLPAVLGAALSTLAFFQPLQKTYQVHHPLEIHL